MQSYAGFGFGLDKNDLKNMDFVSCSRRGRQGLVHLHNGKNVAFVKCTIGTLI